MNYKQRRYKKGLTAYTVAKALGVDFNKYKEVEAKVRPLEQEYVEKFRQVLDNATQYKIERAERLVKAKEERANGTLTKLLKDSGYSQKEVAESLGLTQAAISNTLHSVSSSDETLERLYDFLHNPFNKKLEKENSRSKKVKTEEEVELATDIPDIQCISCTIDDFIPNHEDEHNAFMSEEDILAEKPTEKLVEETVPKVETSIFKDSVVNSLVEENRRLRAELEAFVKLIGRL